MWENTNLGPMILGNPAMLQYLVLQDIQSRSLDGTVVVPSANNGFVDLLDAYASITAQYIAQENKKFESLYPKRAVYSKDLYPFLSDYDYINLTATPSFIKFQLILDKTWIVENAVKVDDNFSKLVIPDTTVITLGNRTFGLYYPIEFLVNKTNEVVTANYNITSVNPLKSYSTNMLDGVYEYTQDSVDYIKIVFTAYQFTKKSVTIVTDGSHGFSNTYTYSDKFYAARVYTYLNNAWTEISYSLSQMAYDVSTATAVLTPMVDTNTIRIDIPQIYYTNGLIGSSLKVDIYTTEGEVNTTIPQTDIDGMLCDIDTKYSVYSAPFVQPSVFVMAPYQQTSLVGGADPKDFKTFRTQLVNRSLYNQVPIWPSELENAVSSLGFNLYKYVDNITDRIFIAGSALTFTDGGQVPTVVSNVVFNNANLSGDPSTIVTFPDQRSTILPTTVFSYSQTTGISTPLTDAQMVSIANMSGEDLVKELNNNTYTRQPFHVVLNTADKYPTAKSYNLMNPTYEALTFVRENPNSIARMTVNDIALSHLVNGTGGYRIGLSVQYTAALSSTPKTAQKVYLVAESKTGNIVYIEADYYSSTTTADVYIATLPTNYYISSDNYIRTYLPDTNGDYIYCDLPLTCPVDILTCVDSEQFPNVAQDDVLVSLLPQVLQGEYLVTTHQSVDLIFGEDLSDLIFNSVNTTWGSEVYATYLKDEYYTYGKDQYLTDSDGSLATRVSTDSTGKTILEVVKTHKDTDYTILGKTVSLRVAVSQTTPTANIVVDDASSVLIGAGIAGPGLSAGTTVTAVDTTSNTITLSAVPTAIVEGAILSMNGADYTATVTTGQTALTDPITIDDATTISVGMTVMGFDIADGTTVATIVGNVITLSAPSQALITKGARLEIFNPQGPYLAKHKAGDIQYDALGNAVVAQSAKNVYGVQMVQFDARLYASTSSTDIAYRNALSSTLTTNSHALDDVRNELLERTSLFYKPYRTIGTAKFGIGGGLTTQLSLAISFTITYYVTEAVLKNSDLCSDIESSTITALSSYVQSNTTMAVSDIAELLKEQFVDNIVALDVSGFYRNDEYKTIALLDTDTSPSIARILDQDADSNIYLKADVDVNFTLDPSATVT